MAHPFLKTVYGELIRGLIENDEKIAYALLGPPGCGKGKQREIVAACGVSGIEMSGLLKKLPNNHVAWDYMRERKMVPNHVVLPLWRHEMEVINFPNLLILDGIPRDSEQFEVVLPELTALGYRTVISYFNVSDELCRHRQSIRNRHVKRIDGDKIDEGLRIYHEETEPVIDLARSYGVPILEHVITSETQPLDLARAIFIDCQIRFLTITNSLYFDVVKPHS